jgi:hypothetical protein
MMSGEIEDPTAVTMRSYLPGCDVVQSGRISVTYWRQLNFLGWGETESTNLPIVPAPDDR